LSGSPTEIEPDDAQQIPFASRRVRGWARRGALRGPELDQKGDLIVDRQDFSVPDNWARGVTPREVWRNLAGESQRPSQPANFVPGHRAHRSWIHRSNTGTAIMPTMFITLRRRASRRWRPWAPLRRRGGTVTSSWPPICRWSTTRLNTRVKRWTSWATC